MPSTEVEPDEGHPKLSPPLYHASADPLTLRRGPSGILILRFTRVNYRGEPEEEAADGSPYEAYAPATKTDTSRESARK